jgi:2-polyprenyl-6-methoxyphenol hydroxylase-like FAD-dependent oxidoreductase
MAATITIETDVLVIGAGPAGALAASHLQRAGIPQLVVEQQTFPRFVIGEAMLPSTMNLLANAGRLAAVEAENFMQKHGAVFLRGSERCDFDFAQQFGTGWKCTYQAPRTALFTHIAGDARPLEREEEKIWVCGHPAARGFGSSPTRMCGRPTVGWQRSPKF